MKQELIEYIGRFLMVMTPEESSQFTAGRTDWPEDTLLKWEGMLAERSKRITRAAKEAQERSVIVPKNV